ncbi:MAG: TetR/AcrR family transcriptional regulator, partial [Planctomycetota bacterium]
VCDRLLDAAEQLFAQKGFNGTSIRHITTKASTNIAAVNYHFGGKEKLYIEVFQRRMGEMRNIRTARIEKVMAQTDPEPTLEKLLREFATAFIEPLIDNTGGSLFMKLMIHEMSDPHLPRRMFIDELAAPTLSALGKGIARVCPGLEQDKIVFSIISIIGQLVHIIHLNKLFDLGDFVESPTPALAEMVDHIVEFSAAGIRAAAKRTD